MTWVFFFIIWNYAQRLNYKRIRKREFLIAQAFGLRGREKKPPGDVWQFILFFGATFLPGIENEKKSPRMYCLSFRLVHFVLWYFRGWILFHVSVCLFPKGCPRYLQIIIMTATISALKVQYYYLFRRWQVWLSFVQWLHTMLRGFFLLNHAKKIRI